MLTPTGNRSNSTANLIRERVRAGGEHYWKLADFPDAPATAVAKALSRLTRKGELQRVGKGIYYHPRSTVFGQSKPTQDAILSRRLKQRLLPAGLTAANLLGFSTQNPGRREYATTASAVAFTDDTLHVTTRRPKSWDQLSSEDAAFLDFLRGRGNNSDLSAEATASRLLTQLGYPERFQRLVELEMPSALLFDLRNSLNPRSRFDFGALRCLKHARDWQV